MTHAQAINLLLENIEKLELPKINKLNHLENREPIIYLCGKSSSGKTTFLNALFNMEKDELFTSTNISTKTEFHFQYGKNEIIKKSDGTRINLPDNYQEKKQLFKTINEEGSSYRIILNQEALKNRVIVDIPGVLDFQRNDSFFNKMLDKADIVYFFTPCTSKIDDSEYKLLHSITKAGIPIIILFTMGDITDVDEGITRKTIPQLVQNRLDSRFKGLGVEHHQIISSNDFYKEKDTHGIDLLTYHIEANDQQYKQKSEKKRLESSVQHYVNVIKDKLELLNSDSKSYQESVIKEINIRYKTKKKELENENDIILQSFYSELNWIKKNCKEQILSNLLKEHDPESTFTSSQIEKKFQKNWEESWEALKNDFDFLEIRGTELPPFPEHLFDRVTIDTRKLKEYYDTVKKTESRSKKKDDSNSQESKKENKKSKDQSTATAQNRTKLIVEKEKDQPATNEGWKDLSVIDYVELAYDLGFNPKNGKILADNYIYLNKVQSLIEKVRNNLFIQIEKEFQSRLLRLEEDKRKELERKLSKDPTTAPKNKYEESLRQLKKI